MTQPSTSPTASNFRPTSRRRAGAIQSAIVIVGAVAILGGALAASLFLTSGPAKESKAGSGGASDKPVGDPVAGQKVVMKYGCVTCHSADGSRNRGPTWQGLYGSVVTYDDGSTGLIDEAAVREALRNPTGKIIEGFEGIMPKQLTITEPEIVDLVAYMRSIGVKK